MWKKQDDDVPTPLEIGSKQMPELGQLLAEELMGIHTDSQSQAVKSSVGLPEVETQDQLITPATIATYTQSVNEFTKNATAFIGYLTLLSEARVAYEQAIKTSAELRKFLDSGDENLRTLMTHLEQMVNTHLVKSAPDKKRPEPSKVEAIRGADKGGIKKWP